MLAAIARQNLFDINRLLSATAISSTILLMLLAALMFVSPRLARFTESLGLLPSNAQPMISFVLAALILGGARPMSRAFDGFFLAEQEAFERRMRQLLSEISAKTSPEALVVSVAEQLVALVAPESYSLYYRRGRVFVPLRAVPEDARELRDNDPAVAVIAKLTAPLVAESSSKLQQFSAFERAALEELGAAAVVPIRGRRSLAAFIIIGPKESGDLFVSSESAWLSALADKASTQLVLLETGSLEAPVSGPDRPDPVINVLGSTLPSSSALGSASTHELPPEPSGAFGECPSCGRCFDIGVTACPVEGARLQTVALPRQLEHRYQLERKLGSGGMGTVYEATDLTLARKVAIKVIRQEWSHDIRSAWRFRREAQSIASFSHPNVVTVFDFGVAERTILFLVMERLEGESLQETLRRSGRLPPGEVLQLMDGIAAGVGVAHEARLVHRDLKPANIFLHRQGRLLTPKILDFGLVKVLAQHTQDSGGESLTGGVVGTPAYVSPECLRNDPPAPSWDLWGLGLIAYEMLTGQRPFQGSLPAIQYAVLFGSPRPVAECLPDAPESLDRFFARALAPEPKHRPETAAAFYSELRDALSSWLPDAR
jgi:serine/threonine-protein kinase